MRADERREQVLTVAMTVFARGGYEGTSTEDVAREAGISQPYLFRLFETKKALFITLIERGFARVGREFEQAAAGRNGEEALTAMGQAYGRLLADRSLLLLQMHAYAACEDADIQAATRTAFKALWQLVSDVSGMTTVELTDFFAHGMLLNVVAAMDASDLGEAWVRACLAGVTR